MHPIAQPATEMSCSIGVSEMFRRARLNAAHVDFNRFIAEVASVYTRAVVHDWLASD